VRRAEDCAARRVDLYVGRAGVDVVDERPVVVLEIDLADVTRRGAPGRLDRATDRDARLGLQRSAVVERVARAAGRAGSVVTAPGERGPANAKAAIAASPKAIFISLFLTRRPPPFVVRATVRTLDERKMKERRATRP